MLTPELEQLIEYAIKDGEISIQERNVLYKKAQESGMNIDEFEMILNGKLQEAKDRIAATAPKPNSKLGEVRKCPSCGATVSSFSTICSECGFEFNNVEALKSANVLFDKLQELEMQKARELTVHEEAKNRQLMMLSEKHNNNKSYSIFQNSKAISERQNEERDDLIRTFEKSAVGIERKYLDAKINMIKIYAVPNTKADLLELLSMATSSAYDNDGVIGAEEEAWLQKADQIYQKLIICAADDKVTLNQATNMIVSLIKRLPQDYKNFTRIPKDLRDKINNELKAQKAEQDTEFRKNILNLITGWRGIAFIVALVILALDYFVFETKYNLYVIMLLAIIYLLYNTYNAIQKIKENFLE